MLSLSCFAVQLFIDGQTYLHWKPAKWSIPTYTGLLQAFAELPQQFFDTMRVGEIISRINDAVKISLLNDVSINFW